ncbi:MAG: hypothetical protein LUD02_03735 [Tannerellaceae bacterium]|nr:hypothetical protein [Tannerellaceae bacterium]MCD8263368.1 hypothetical protein [Tannerellaceae bacterium]
MRINIFGASDTGTTTLGRLIAKETSFTQLDSEYYYWLPEGRPYEFKREKQKRNEMLFRDMLIHNDVIVSGTVFKWSKRFLACFDLVVFLYAPLTVRLERLIERDVTRYGNRLENDEYIKEKHHSLITMTSQYEDLEIYNSRSFRQHEAWLKELKCPVLRIDKEFH